MSIELENEDSNNTILKPTTNDDEDDDPPLLSVQAMEALREFLSEQNPRIEEEEVVAKLVSENWNLSQFWYDKETAETVCEEIRNLAEELTADSKASVACVSCPTLCAYLKKNNPNIPVQLLEYDMRFKQFGGDFTFYDYNQPEELPESLRQAFQIVVADPPYLSKECLEKVAQTISFLASPQKFYLLLLTGEVQKDRAAELLNLRPCAFRPQHSNKLGNEFRLFTNYDPGRLGGWERSI